MRDHLDTIPAGKFPNLYVAIQRQNRIDAAIRLGVRIFWIGSASLVGLLIGDVA